ncbi:MAG: hypothetical protein LBU14_01795 [Candidatus Peribacteria bacterium]|jgi:hypothetical protein|nr:hypothetical protein [Candidatus Peribacteria bacterium]
MAPIKKIFVLLILILLTNTSLTFAIEESSVNQEIVQKELNLTTKDAIIFLGALIENIPESYKYIQLNFKNIEK